MTKANFRVIAVLCLSIVIALGTLFAKDDSKSEKKDDPMSSGTFSGLEFRSIGPAVTSGRIVSIAVDPKSKSTWYIGSASGGVWKTTNAGVTFSPLFDGQGSYSIGCVVVDPSNSAVVWVGTGENNSQRSVSYGDGIYRSEDGGKSWKNMGLKKSEHIARIVFDPRNTNTVYAACQGPLWGPGGDRGLFKTTDAGKTWKNVLSISENTGVSDVVIDPKDPDVLIASTYQRRRREWTLIDGGPESGIQKTTDGGATWTKLKSGLPGGDLGRIGLAMAPTNSQTLYATVEAAENKGGVFRSLDQGASWTKQDGFDATAMYYATIFIDPKNPDRIFVMNFMIQVSDDAGKTMRNLPSKSKHVDNHVMWIDPDNTDHYLVGCDGGLYESFDRAANWQFFGNLPVTQFYDVDVDNSLPFYYVYGGTQDNSSLGGPSQSRNYSGAVNTDWFVTQGGDGFQSRIDPLDPNTVYAESQYGGLGRYNRATGEQVGIQPMEGKGEDAYRWNWDSPIIISPHSHTRLYFAADKLFRSDDRGDTWKAMSGVLHRPIDRNAIPIMGKVWPPDAVAKNASTSVYGNCTTISESPLKEGLIFVGVDDGVIQVTQDGGATWKMLDGFPGVPDTIYTSRVLASQHDVNTVYAAFVNHRSEDFAPYIIKSTDGGASWVSIKGDLPENGPVLAIAEDDKDPSLLFVGTEFGMYFTKDGGKKWIQLKGGLPTIAVRDIAIQKREGDLVIATFGRGFYVLDNYEPLRSVNADSLAKEAVIFPVKDASVFLQANPYGGGKKGAFGETFFTAPNPPFGATFTYYLKDSYKSLKEKRHDAEAEAIKNKTKMPYATKEQLRAEDEEEAPSVFFVVTDAQGRVVNRVNAGNSGGIARATWDLHYPPVTLGGGGGDDAQDGDNSENDGGALVLPGKYQVALYKRVQSVTTKIAGPEWFNVKMLDSGSTLVENFASLQQFQQRAAALLRQVSGALETARSVRSRLGSISSALKQTPANTDSLVNVVAKLDQRINSIELALVGDNSSRGRNEAVPPAINDRIHKALDDGSSALAKPTQTDVEAFRIASSDFKDVVKNLRSLITVDLADLDRSLEAIGAPWTPGRLPEWNGE